MESLLHPLAYPQGNPIKPVGLLSPFCRWPTEAPLGRGELGFEPGQSALRPEHQP